VIDFFEHLYDSSLPVCLVTHTGVDDVSE